MYTGNMEENVDLNRVENVDPSTIEDEGVRQVVMTLMNLVETLSAKAIKQAEEIQRLRDEIHRLKGEQGKPTFTPKKLTPLPFIGTRTSRVQTTPQSQQACSDHDRSD